MQKYDPQEPEGEAKRTEQIELLRFILYYRLHATRDVEGEVIC